MIVLSLLLSICFLPVFLPVLLLFYIFKQIIHLILKFKYGARIEFLDSADTYWAVGENHHNQSYILTILNDNGNGEVVSEIRNIIVEKLLKHPENSRKILSSLHTCLGYPYLLHEQFEANDFITVLETNKTSYRSINDIIYDLSIKPLPLNSKLLWEIIVIKAPYNWKQKEGLKHNQIPLILRENHTLTDGLSLMNLFINSFSDQSVDFSKYLKNIPKSPKRKKLLKFCDNLLLFLMVPGHFVSDNIGIKFNKQLWKGPKIVNKLNVAYKKEDTGVDLVENIKSIKRKIGDTSFTEIVIAGISASLHRHFLQNCTYIPDTILLLVVATKDLKPMTINNIPILKNQFGMINFELPIKIDNKNSMLERLQILKGKTRPLLKSPTTLVDTFILFNLMSLFPTYIIKRLFPFKETAGMSNLPGFPRISVCNGYEIEDVYFFLPQRDTLGISFSVLTYDNKLHIGLTADEASINSRSQCEDIVNDIFKNIEILQEEVTKRKLNSDAVVDLEYD